MEPGKAILRTGSAATRIGRSEPVRLGGVSREGDDGTVFNEVHDIPARRGTNDETRDFAPLVGFGASEQRLALSGDKEILQSRVEDEGGRIYLLRAVIAIEKDPPVVVTVYRTSKLEKYWRPE